LARTNTL